MPNNNPESINILSTRIEEIDREIAQLYDDIQNDKKNNTVNAGRLIEYEALIDKAKDYGILGKEFEKNGASGMSNRKINKIIRNIKKTNDKLTNLKNELNVIGLTPGAEARTHVRAFDTRQLDNVVVGPDGVSITKPDAITTTNQDIRKSTEAEKQTAIANIDAGNGKADDYKVAGSSYLDHVIQKNTHATPGQAKTMKYLAAGAGAFLIGKRALEDGFSMKTFAKLGAIYAGTTMATGMNPIELASAMLNGGHYPLLGIDPVSGDKEGKEKSVIAEKFNSSQIGDGIINSIKPKLLSKYLSADGGQVKIDMLKILNDVSIDGQQITNLADIKCALSVDKINDIFGPHHGLTGQQIFSILLAPAQAGKIAWIDKSLTTHFTNLEPDNTQWSALLANPSDLVTKSKLFTERLTTNAVDQVKRLKTEAQYAGVLVGHTLTPGFEVALIDEMLKMEMEIDPKAKIDPSTYALPAVGGSFDYDKLKQRLIDKKIISVASLANNPDAKGELITTTMSLLAPYNFIDNTQRRKFAEAFVDVKADYDPQNHHQLELRVLEVNGKSQLWIQNSTAAFALSGIDESTLNIDLESMGTTVKGGPNVAGGFEQKLAFAFASLELIGKAAGNIAHPKDKPQNANDTNRPFKVSGKSIALSTKTGFLDFGGDSKYDHVNKIMTKLDADLGGDKAGRMRLCAMFNGMRFKGGVDSGALIWDINEGKLPEKMMPISSNGDTRKENAGFYAGQEYEAIYSPTFQETLRQAYGEGVKVINVLYEGVTAGLGRVVLDLSKPGGGVEQVVAIITTAGIEIIGSVSDIFDKGIYQQILKPLYSEIRSKSKDILQDVEKAIKAFYDSIKGGAAMVGKDFGDWLKSSEGMLKWYQLFKDGLGGLGSDVSAGLDRLGRDIGAKLGGVAEWTLEGIGKVIGMTAGEIASFVKNNNILSGMLAGGAIMMTGVGPGYAFYGAIATMMAGFAGSTGAAVAAAL